MNQTEEEKIKKGPITDEERLQLAAKLDKDLDDFINGLEKKQYTEGWPEEKWEEEMEKHPFFMKNTPEVGSELHPLYQGLQQLKYDPAENTAEELATSYKEDGNFNFKHKNYRLAILAYTEALKQKHDNNDLKATLYNNRAASNFFLKNYRSSLRDCELALRLKPDYTKVLNRAAQCCFETSQWDKCLQYCDDILLDSSNDSAILALRQKAINARKEDERDHRRRKHKVAKLKDAHYKLLKAIDNRKIKLAPLSLDKLNDDTFDSLKPIIGQLEGTHVRFDETDQLVWPMVLVYPEFGIMDFIREFPEDVTIHSQLSEVFYEPAEWDPQHRYNADSVSAYYEIKYPTGTVKLQNVSSKFTLLEVMTSVGYVIYNGTPQLIIVERGSDHEKNFVSKYN